MPMLTGQCREWSGIACSVLLPQTSSACNAGLQYGRYLDPMESTGGICGNYVNAFSANDTTGLCERPRRQTKMRSSNFRLQRQSSVYQIAPSEFEYDHMRIRTGMTCACCHMSEVGNWQWSVRDLFITRGTIQKLRTTCTHAVSRPGMQMSGFQGIPSDTTPD
jgi:hypothetical protein